MRARQRMKGGESLGEARRQKRLGRTGKRGAAQSRRARGEDRPAGELLGHIGPRTVYGLQEVGAL